MKGCSTCMTRVVYAKGMCCKCYKAEYYRQNKAEKKKKSKRYYDRNKRVVRARTMQYYRDNREIILLKTKVRYYKRKKVS
jgi:putative lipase involved disintegration of autophagic bodies